MAESEFFRLVKKKQASRYEIRMFCSGWLDICGRKQIIA
jgi:hypothetical protein